MLYRVRGRTNPRVRSWVFPGQPWALDYLVPRYIYIIRP